MKEEEYPKWLKSRRKPGTAGTQPSHYFSDAELRELIDEVKSLEPITNEERDIFIRHWSYRREPFDIEEVLQRKIEFRPPFYTEKIRLTLQELKERESPEDIVILMRRHYPVDSLWRYQCLKALLPETKLFACELTLKGFNAYVQ